MTKAEQRKPDVDNLGVIAMTTPDDDPAEARMRGFKDGEITDTPLIQASAVIDDQDITGSGAGHCFKEDIDRTRMSDRQSGTGQSHSCRCRP